MHLTNILVSICYLFTLYFLIYWFILYLEKSEDIHAEIKKRKKIKEFPFVTIVIPCYNEESSVRATLRSISKLNYPRQLIEVLVIDDGSTDNTRKEVNKFISGRKDYFYYYQKNKGKASALNYGISLARGSLFACLDADSFVHRNALRNIVAEYAEDQNLAIVTPVIKIDNPKSMLQKVQRLEYIISMLIIKLMGYMNCNYIAPGPFSVYRTEAVKKLGGFDEENLVEDQEIAYRAQERHFKIKQCTTAFVTTISPKDFRELDTQRNRWFKGSILNLIKYRSLIMNKDYGDFGAFQMPINIISFFLALASLFLFAFLTVKPLVSWIHDLYLVHFDIMPYIRDFHYQLNLLNYDMTLVFATAFVTAISFLLLYFASRTSNDRIRQYGTLHIVPYFFVYYLMMSFIIFKVAVELIFRKKQRW